MKNINIFSNPPKIYTQKTRFIQTYGQCDACSPVVFLKKEKPIFETSDSEYMKNENLVTQKIDENHIAFLNPQFNSFSVLNKSAFDYFQNFTKQVNSIKLNEALSNIWNRTTVKKILYQMINLGILVDANATQPLIQYENFDTLTVWLHITDRCNLRCNCCYLNHDNSDMSQKVGIAAIESIFRSATIHNFSNIKIKYAGGEPLLMLDLIEKLHQYATNLSVKNSINLDEVILTNGTLLDIEKINLLKLLGIRISISLDETGKSSNQQRVFPNGRGSAEKVIRAIDTSLHQGLTPTISITLTSNNINELPDLLKWILDRKLLFFINFDRRIDDVHNKNLRSLNPGELSNGIRAGYKKIEQNLPQNSLLACISDRLNLSAPRLRTCSAGMSYLVIDTSGKVHKCQMKMNNPVTDIYSNDPLFYVQKDKSVFKNVPVNEKILCSNCKLKYWCTGGCPLNTQANSSENEKIPPYCNLYKSLFPEIVRLEGLRILKYERN